MPTSKRPAEETLTKSERRQRRRAFSLAWARENPGKLMYGTREQVLAGKRFCTRGDLLREDLFLDEGVVKSRALSRTMISSWRQRRQVPKKRVRRRKLWANLTWLRDQEQREKEAEVPDETGRRRGRTPRTPGAFDAQSINH